MRKQKTAPAAYFLSAMLLLTGCADKGTLGQPTVIENVSDHNSPKNETSNADAETLIPLTTVRETFDGEAEKIKGRKFDNINFENACFSFPEISEACTLEFVKTQFTLSPDEAYDYMCKRVDEFFPGMFSDEEKANVIRFTDSERINEEPSPDCYPTLEQYKEMKLMTDQPFTSLSNENIYIGVCCGTLFRYVDGSLENYRGQSEQFNEYWELRKELWEQSGGFYAGGFDAVQAYQSVFRTEELDSGKTFRLASGEASIAQAADYAQKYLSELEISMRELPFEMRLRNVYVLDIGDGSYAFYFTIAPEYKKMKFDCVELDESSYGFSPISNTTNEERVAGHLVMYDKDKISRINIGTLTYDRDVVQTDSRTDVIPLEKAAELASRHLTRNMRFKAKSVSAVYKEFADKDLFDVPEEERDKRKITVNPCWKFLLQPTNEPKKLFHVYVDMLTGKVDTFVQLMSSYEE